MKTRLKKHLLSICAAALCAAPLGAGAGEAIWHCSRQSQAPVETASIAPEDEFRLSSLDVVGVMLQDLLNVYTGRDVTIGQKPLSGCFMPGGDELSLSALRSLGLKSYVMQKLSAKSSIAQTNLYEVTDETQMLACIEKHYPAFGYLSQENITEKVAPCF